MIRNITINDQIIAYELEYKKVKNMNLRVRKDGSIHVSANRMVSRQQADQFVINNAEFVLRARARIQQRLQQQKEDGVGKDRTYEDGSFLNLYGDPFRIRIFEGKKDSVEAIGQVLVVTLKDKENAVRCKKVLEGYLAEECMAQMQRLCEQVYPAFARQGVLWPEIRVRSMTSRWGSCQPGKKILTFARQLVSAPAECQEYVVVHEFMHFLQADHSPRFHALMTEMMPDWKERKKLLNSRTWV